MTRKLDLNVASSLADIPNSLEHFQHSQVHDVYKWFVHSDKIQHTGKQSVLPQLHYWLAVNPFDSNQVSGIWMQECILVWSILRPKEKKVTICENSYEK